MLSRIVAELERCGFATQRTSWSELVGTEALRQLANATALPDCDSARILRYFPDLFVVHKTLPPEKGVFFVVAESEGTSKRDALETYRRFFPPQIVLVSLDKAGGLVARWLSVKDQPIGLDKFLSNEFGV